MVKPDAPAASFASDRLKRILAEQQQFEKNKVEIKV
jgi:hypothetical protein